jgi:hypothetical protein
MRTTVLVFLNSSSMLGDTLNLIVKPSTLTTSKTRSKPFLPIFRE